jgi:hypothetical protein
MAQVMIHSKDLAHQF